MADNGRIVTFFDPHPGFAGAAIPIPAAVKQAADALDGLRIPLKNAIALIQATTDGSVYDVPDHGFVALRLKDASSREHLFRIIKYR